MSDKAFIDTNILIYAYDLDAGEKRVVAADLLRDLWRNATGVLSTQVLQEFYVNVTAKKIPKPLSPAEAREVISRYRAWPIEAPSADSILRASEVQERYNLSFWDALIVVAAANAGAATLFSEDLNHGQAMEGVTITNPFLIKPT